MAKVDSERPEIVILRYTQEKGDPDYGSCMWARFYFDLRNYTLSIESDCGTYSYGWVPTPNSESFLHLMGRINKDYLLNKISSRTDVDCKEAEKAVLALLHTYNEDGLFTDDDDPVWESVHFACCYGESEFGMLEAIMDALGNTVFEGHVSREQIADCICTDYPAGAKKIAQVFQDHIKPVIREMATLSVTA